MLSERSLLFAFGGGFNSVDKQSSSIGLDLPTTPSPVLATASAYICLEKAKKKKLSAQATETDKTTASTKTQLDSFDNVIMESASNKNNNCNRNTNINHNNNNNNNNNIANALVNSLSGSSVSLTIPNMTNNHPYQQQTLHPNSQQHQTAQKQPQKNFASNIGIVKREEVSPGPCTNGDLPSSVVRSRSTTPSSFRGASPQQISSESLIPLSSLLRIQAASVERHNSSVIGPNMDTINVNTTNALPPEFSTRNYSDIMRSLAAKYNDSSQTNSSSARRNTFFEASSTPPASVTSKNINQQTGNSKSAAVVLPNATPKEDTQPQLLPRLSMSPGEVAVAAAAASFLTNLPFSQSVCPPLIDMSSTQALVTLARAAKEAEIQTILRCPQQNLKSISSTSILPHPNLTVALQQAAQFVSPALMYSAQLQQQLETQSSHLPSPLQKLNNVSSNSSDPASKNKKSGATNTATVPLDLSSQPPAAKRFKVELNAAGSTIESDDLKISIGSSPLFGSSNTIQRIGSNTPEKLGDTCLSVSPVLAIRKSTVTPQCRAHSEEVAQWTVEDVCAFVAEIDICADYVKHFRDQCIDGSGLPLLTEDHLLNSLGMKLGPALKLRSMLAKKLGGPCPCVACITQARQVLALHTAARTDAVSPRVTTATEAPAESGGTTSISDINHIEKQNQEERQEGQTQQVTEQRQASFCSNNDNNSNCAALTLQICANIYKSDANSNNPNEKKTNNENETSGPRIANKATGGSIDTIESIENKDCKISSRCVGNSNTNNGSLQQTGSNDIADVGS